jgi:uncharacterized membrane protein YciS (DUF1049 family)
LPKSGNPNNIANIGNYQPLLGITNGGYMWAVRAVLIALLIIVLVAFAYTNLQLDQKVSINVLTAKYVNVPLLTVVFWAFVGGILVSLILFISIYIRLSVQLRSANKRVFALESEVTVLRNRPIEESAELISGGENNDSEEKSPFDNGE